MAQKKFKKDPKQPKNKFQKRVKNVPKKAKSDQITGPKNRGLKMTQNEPKFKEKNPK